MPRSERYGSGLEKPTKEQTQICAEDCEGLNLTRFLEARASHEPGLSVTQSLTHSLRQSKLAI